MHLKDFLAPVLLCSILAGCGSGDSQSTAELAAVSKLAASQPCISCHGADVSPGTGMPIVSEWQASTHNTRNGAGCADCHEPAADHPNVCNSCHGGGSPAGYDVTTNPDAAGICAKCHSYLLRNDVMMLLAPQHFNNVTASATNTTSRASYVTSRYVGHCTYCHNPHDTTTAMPQASQWANSLLSTKGTAFGKSQLQGTTVPAPLYQGDAFCVRCHTTTGFVNFVSVDATGQRFNDQQAWTLPGDKTIEVVGCDACHDNGNGSSYGYAVRSIPAVSVYYNYSSNVGGVKVNNTPTIFPDFGNSNICVPCHAGRNNIGPTITKIEAFGLDFSNGLSPGSGHNRLAPLTLAQNGFYEFPGRDYDNPGYQHATVGTGNLRGTGTSGPCVTCHIANGGGHLFYPVTFSSAGIITQVTTTTCASCHDGSYQQAWTPATLQAQRDGYASALAILGLLRNYSSSLTVPGATKYPKGITNGKTNANPNWTLFAPGAPHTGANTMGAVYNYSQIVADPAGFAHNSRYVRRLIYDSIDWLQDGILGDNDVESAINGATLSPSTSAATHYYVSLAYPLPGGTAFIASQPPSATTAALFAKVKSDAINWLIGGPGGGRP